MKLCVWRLRDSNCLAHYHCSFVKEKREGFFVKEKREGFKSCIPVVWFGDGSDRLSEIVKDESWKLEVILMNAVVPRCPLPSCCTGSHTEVLVVRYDFVTWRSLVTLQIIMSTKL